MSDGHFPTLVSKDRNVNAVADPIWVELSDGAAVLHKVVDSAAGGTDTGIAPLAVRDDALAALTPADGDYVLLRTNANGALWVEDVNGAGSGPSKDDDSAFSIGVDKVGPAGFLADETTPDSVDEGDVGLARMTLDRKQLFVLTDPTTDANRLAIDSSGRPTVNVNGTVTVSASDLDIRDLTSASDSVEVLQDTHDDLNANANLQVGNADVANGNPVPVSDAGGSITVDASDLDIRNLNLTDDAVKVSANATANSVTNPIFVQMVSTGILGNEIHNYDTTADVASDTGDNHDYTVTGTTFLLKSVIFAASGGLKVEVRTGPVASLATKAVAFISKEGGFGQLFFDPPIEVPATSTGTIRVVRTNRQGQAQDVYSTIIGNDVA